MDTYVMDTLLLCSDVEPGHRLYIWNLNIRGKKENNGCVIGFMIGIDSMNKPTGALHQSLTSGLGKSLKIPYKSLLELRSHLWKFKRFRWSFSHVLAQRVRFEGGRTSLRGSYVLWRSKGFFRCAKIKSEFTLADCWIGVNYCNLQCPSGASFCPFMQTFLGCGVIIAFWVSPHFLQLDGILWWCHISIVSHVRSAKAVRGQL